MTDQPKWTPGPWAVERNKRTWGWVDVVGPSLGVGGPTQATDLTLADEVKRIAEARLIAAAPDMATVLEYYADQFCEGFCKDLPQAGTYQTEMDLDCSGCKARAALAKARGQA